MHLGHLYFPDHTPSNFCVNVHVMPLLGYQVKQIYAKQVIYKCT